MQKNNAYKQANKNFPLPKKEIDKKNKRIASIILCVLMVVWTLGAVCGFVALGKDVFKPKSASAVELTDDIDKVYYGSALPVATFSDWVHESENKFFVTHEKKSTTNNVDGAYNGIKGTFTANVNRPGEWGAYSLMVPLKALYSAIGSYNYNYFFHSFITEYSPSNSGMVRVNLFSDLNTSVAGYQWQTPMSWAGDGYITNRNVNLNIDLSDLPTGFDDYYLQFGFYFFGIDTEYVGENSITFTDIGLYSSFDNNNPLTADTIPDWTANYGYIYNSAYNDGYDSGYVNGSKGILEHISDWNLYAYNESAGFFENSIHSSLGDFDLNYNNHTLSIVNFDFDTFGGRYSGWSNYTLTSTITFDEPISLNNQAFNLYLGRDNTSLDNTLNVYVRGYVTTTVNGVVTPDHYVDFYCSLLEVIKDGVGTGFYTLDYYSLFNATEFNGVSFRVNETFKLLSVGFTNEYYVGSDTNLLFTQIVDLSSGYNLGYNAGFNAGSVIGNDNLQGTYNNGYNQGLLDGEAVGFNKGVASANDYTFLGLFGAVVDAPLQALSGLLNFDILGFNMLNFFYSLITLCIIITIVRLVLMK